MLFRSGKSACYYFIDGFCKDEIMEKVLEFLYGIKPEDMPKTPQDFMETSLPYGEIDLLTQKDELIQNVSFVLRSLKIVVLASSIPIFL